MMDLPQRERHTFSRGAPEPIKNVKHPQWTASLYDLLSVYSVQRQKTALSQVRFKKRHVWTLAEARQQIERLIGTTDDWNRLDQFLIAYLVEPSMVATVTAAMRPVLPSATPATSDHSVRLRRRASSDRGKSRCSVFTAG